MSQLECHFHNTDVDMLYPAIHCIKCLCMGDICVCLIYVDASCQFVTASKNSSVAELVSSHVMF